MKNTMVIVETGHVESCVKDNKKRGKNKDWNLK